MFQKSWTGRINYVDFVKSRHLPDRMRLLLWIILMYFPAVQLLAQSFQMGDLQDVYKGYIGETVKVPLTFTNNTEKPLTLIIRRISSTIGGTQKNYFCTDINCLDQRVEDFMVRLEPRQSLSSLQVALDAGLANGISNIKYLVFNRNNSAENVEFDVNFAVEERSAKEDIFTHPQIVLHDVYPNPVVDFAYVNYNMTSDNLEAKIVIHNILGNAIDEYNLPPSENTVKIRAEALNAGIYFYTLYLDNEGLVTRKLIVKK